jgi:hypothetical protein
MASVQPGNRLQAATGCLSSRLPQGPATRMPSPMTELLRKGHNLCGMHCNPQGLRLVHHAWEA